MSTAMGSAFSKLFSGREVQVVDNPNVEANTPARVEQRAQGKIIKVSDSGWGFISSKEIKFTRIFFHWTSLRQDTLKFTDLKTGMVVEFTPVEIEGKGTRAIKIRVITQPSVTTPTEASAETTSN